MDFMHLKSGSDIRGEAVASLCTPATLTGDVARRVGYAFVEWLAQRLCMPTRGLTIAVGRDSRISGPALLGALAQGMAAGGARVLDCGLCTTPAMFMTIITPDIGCQGSVMITASHHPSTRNGFKFFTAQGGLGGEDIRWLLARAAACRVPEGSGDPVEPVPFLQRYTDFLKRLVRKELRTQAERPLEGLHVVVDAGNGAGGFYAGMLAELGANVSGSQYLEPDGRFPNHIPNPEDDEAMASVCSAVRVHGADLGIIFDADCDRAAIVDCAGKAIHRNRLIALTAAMLLPSHPGATIVTDSVTSTGLARFIASQGGVHLRYKRGYRNVIDEAVRLNQAGQDCPLAMETSGHAALRENHFLDDGMYLVTRLLVAAMECRARGEDVTALIGGLEEAAETSELRLSILAQDFAAAGQQALEALRQAAARWVDAHIAPDNHEGLRVYADLCGGAQNAWLMMRLSVHDPVLPVNVESEAPGGVRTLLARLREALSGCSEVDLAPLDAALESQLK